MSERGGSSGLDYLPLFLDVRDQPVLVAGGGVVAARKVELLLRAGARVTVVAPQLAPEFVSLLPLAARRRLRHIEAAVEPGHLQGARLVIAATDSSEVNRRVARLARAAQVPVNAVDDPRHSTFIVPAIVDRSPLVVAVGTSGLSPVLARQIRAQLEALLPARLGALARFAGRWRKEVRRRLRPAERRSFWERILHGAVGTQVLAGREEAAARALAQELASAEARAGATVGEVYLIGAGPGDPDLLTLRAAQLLQQADVVLYDRLVSPAVLARARRDAQLVFVGKQAGAHHATQARINELLIGHARAGRRVARLKGGDPLVFGRGGEELEALAAHGIPVVVVPGITAALGAAAGTAIPLTHRSVAQSLTIVTGHAAEEESLDWASLARARQTVVFYMAVGRLAHIVHSLLGAGAPASRPAAIIERATLPEERLIRGTLATIEILARESEVAAPALLIVGEVVDCAAPAAKLAAATQLRSVA